MVPEPVGSTHLRFDDARVIKEACGYRMLFGVPDKITDMTRSLEMVKRYRLIYRMMLFGHHEVFQNGP